MIDHKRASIIQSLKDLEFDKIKNTTLLKQSFSRADSKTKGLISALSILIVVSLLSTILSSYYVFTKPVRSNTGSFLEAVIGGNVTGFNPVVDNAEIGVADTLEQKVNRLVYAPLYTISVGDTNDLNQSTFKINPVLLSGEPVWAETTGENAYKSLKLNIKNGVKWSDGKNITCGDIGYTIERLKEPRASTLFKKELSEVTFNEVSDKECVLNFKQQSPSALYKLGFSPIPKHVFENMNIDGIVASPKYKNPEVVSGYYKVPTKVKDIRSENKEFTNPVKVNGKIDRVILTKSGVDNYGQGDVAFEQYTFKNFDSLTPDKVAANTNTVAASSEKGFVDLFIRNYDQNISNSSDAIKAALKIDQKVIPNNNYLQLFYNIQKGNEGYLINQSLRKYISCNLLNFNSVSAKGFYNPVSKDRKIIPVELNAGVSDLSCELDSKAMLDKVYKFNDIDGKERISIGTSNPFTLTLIGYKEHLDILNELKAFLSNIGIDTKIISDDSQVLDSLNNKTYHIALLNNRIDSFDLLSEFSAKEQNLVSIPANDRIAQYDVNQNLENFTYSNGTNEEARQNLIKFFSEQFVFMNLYQSNSEVNYSNKIFGLKESLPNFTGAIQTSIYNNMQHWYKDTKRKFKFSK